MAAVVRIGSEYKVMTDKQLNQLEEDLREPRRRELHGPSSTGASKSVFGEEWTGTVDRATRDIVMSRHVPRDEVRVSVDEFFYLFFRRSGQSRSSPTWARQPNGSYQRDP